MQFSILCSLLVGHSAALHVAVAGATGRTGQLVVDKLLRDGHRVTALVRSMEKAEETLPLARIEAANVIDFATATSVEVEAATAGVDRLVWCASGFSESNMESVDILGMRLLPSIFASSEQQGSKAAPKVVFLSSAGVTRPAWSDAKKERLIGASDIPIIRLNPGGILGKKVEAEDMLRNSGTPYCVVRPTGLKFEGWPKGRPIVSQGDVAVGRTNPSDLADVLVGVLDEPSAAGKTFECFTLAGYPAPAGGLGPLLETLSRDADGPLDESAVDATYAALQQLLPGEQQDATKLEMGRTYEEVDTGVVVARERGAAPTEREMAVASNALRGDGSGTSKSGRVRKFFGRLLAK